MQTPPPGKPKRLNPSFSVLRLAGLALVGLLVSFGLAPAENQPSTEDARRIGFRRTTALDRLVNPALFPARAGLTFAVRDTTRSDTLLKIAADSAAVKPDTAAADTISPQPTAFGALKPGPAAPLPTGLQKTGLDTISPPPSVEIKSALSIDSVKTAAGEVPVALDTAQVEPLPIRPTLIRIIDLPVEAKTSIDTATGYVILSHSLAGVNQPFVGALTGDQFLSWQSQRSDRDSRRKTILSRYPNKAAESRTGITISIPLIKSPGAQRIFGGSNIGLTVAGSITVEGSLITERKNEIARDQRGPTNYALKINQKQQFDIKGKVGEKVSVEISQDSEKLFEFENSLKVRYKGDEDEIIKSIEAGNVDLSLRGTNLASASNQHKGLFGFKTESQFGPLKLTTVASLDKGEKNEIEISGGAKSGRDRPINPNAFAQYRYYFLDSTYRENYKYFDDNRNHVVTNLAPEISEIEVYKTIALQAGQNENAVRGWAFANPHEFYNPRRQPDREHIVGNFLRLEPETDYYVNMKLGYIRLTRPIDAATTLAVAYRLLGDTLTYGDLNPTDNDTLNPFILKLIQPDNPQPTDSLTWKLMWRNIYDLGSTGISPDAFECKIVSRADNQAYEGNEIGDDIFGQRRSYLAIFGLDQFSNEGRSEDGKIDGSFMNYGQGEIIFPDLQPFDPEGWMVVGDTSKHIYLHPDDRVPALYTTSRNELQNIISDFSIVTNYAASSATYDLGFGVLENSEEVTFNGQRLSRGNDYSIDYLSGTLTILNRDALVPGADVKIRYEKGQLFQLDTKTMLGLRAEYDLWDNSYIGGTLLYLNQRTFDQRVRVGGEPLRNTVWGMNTQMRFRAPFLTSAVDFLPLISTDAPSEITLSGEIAQVLPDPNSLNSPSTGDYNGVAYIDDYESIKRSTPLGLTRRQWSPASFPVYDARGAGRWLKQRGRVIWYEPDPIKMTDIWPERETQAQNSTISVLKIDYQPWWTEWGADNPGGIDAKKSWGGIMRYLGAGYADQSQAKYIEIWLNQGALNQGALYIDLGRISEDVLPGGGFMGLNTEDQPKPGFQIGDGLLARDEDTGLDGIMGVDPSDSSHINGIENPKLPSYDDFKYSFSNRHDYSHINGTENNGYASTILEGGRTPDSEDLNGNNNLEQANDFYRYRIDLSEGDLNRYIVGGLGNAKRWRLYRIPLTDTLSVGRPSFTQIEFVRLWFAGFSQRGSIMIAQMEIVGNEWREVQVSDGRGGKIDPVTISVVNTHDNPEYNNALPPGVAGEIDPVTGLRAKEQSLVIKVNKLGTGETGMIHKGLPQAMNLMEYRRLKMFVRGGGYDGSLHNADIEMFFRFGEDSSARRPRYYEYSQRLRPGWAKENEIDIDIERFAGLKFLREKDSLRDYDVLPDGDVIRVVGDPSLRNIRFFAIGIKNHGAEITAQDGVEIWVDELRVADVQRNPGWAATGSFNVKAAKLLDLRGDLRHTQSDFHNLNERTNRDPNKSDRAAGNLSGTFQAGEFFNPQWGISIPISGSFRQEMQVPKYKPNSDVRLASLTSEKVDVWNKFAENLWNRSRYVEQPVYKTPVDSLMITSKSYSLSLRAAKTKKSSSPLVNYTLGNFKLDEASYQESWSSSYNTIYDYRQQKAGRLGYDFSFEKPWELRWLDWASGVPLVNKLSESIMRPLPQSIRFSGNGAETNTISLPRNGLRRPSYNFNVTRGYSAGWRLFSALGFDFGQSVNSSRIIEDSTRTFYASRLSLLDSTAYWIVIDSQRVYDSLGYALAKQRDIDRIKSELFWKLFGYHFVDNDLSENYSINFNPQVFNWLGTELNYRSNYHWGWRDTYGPLDRSVDVNSNFSSAVTFRLTQFTARWGQKSAGTGRLPEPPGEGFFKNDMNQFRSGKGFSSSGKGDWAPNIDEPAPSFPEKPMMDIDAASSTGTGPPSSGATLPTTADDSLISSEKSDSLTLPPVKADTAKPAALHFKPPNPLDGVKFILRRLRDISWNYNLTNGTRNLSVAEGQASWKYRLGFTRDPGLATVPGNAYPNSINNRQEHRFASGFEITPNLSFSNLEYQIVTSRNIGQGENGTFQTTVFQYFGDDKLSIKALPFVNYTLRWSGFERLPLLTNLASSVSLDQTYRGSKTEQWLKTNPDSSRRTTRVEYDKSFSPLMRLNFSWKAGVGSSAAYNWQQQVTDERTGNNVKSRSTTRSITLSANYSARGGFRIPLYIFTPLNVKNTTNFTLNYDNRFTRRESSASGAPFSVSSETAGWSVSPRIEYTFTNAVRGGFRYAYNVQRNLQTGRSKSQEFSFNVNISIRG